MPFKFLSELLQRRLCARPCADEKAGIPDISVACQSEEERSFVNIVESLDQKVGLLPISAAAGPALTNYSRYHEAYSREEVFEFLRPMAKDAVSQIFNKSNGHFPGTPC